MEVVVLVEFEAGESFQRDALLDRVGALALSGQARLSFVATEIGAEGHTRDVVAIGFARASVAAGLLERWRAEAVLAPTTRTRMLTVQPIWSMEPLALMFP